MASPQKLSSGTYYILSRFGGNQYKRSLKTQDARKARFFKTRPEESNHLINGGRLELPVNVDIPTFRLADGKLASRPLIRESRLSGLFDLYFDSKFCALAGLVMSAAIFPANCYWKSFACPERIKAVDGVLEVGVTQECH